MDCKELKKWLLNTYESKLPNLPAEVLEHINGCSACSNKLGFLRSTEQLLTIQKEVRLPDFTTTLIVGKLRQMAETGSTSQFNYRDSFSHRLAITAIIAAGIILGVLAGNLYTRNSTTTESTLWDNEFAIISDNTISSINIFE